MNALGTDTITTWLIAGRHFAAPPPDDWRARLAARLGERPRRIGPWVELALHGALACLDDAGEHRLPDGAALNLATLRGPDLALRATLFEARDGLPLPLGFLASQPSQALPALAHRLGWCGDGRCQSSPDPAVTLDFACTDAGPAGLLAGWVDEGDPLCSIWLRLVPAPAHAPRPARPARFADLSDPAVRLLAVDAAGLLIHREESIHG